jgi:hypothetical protein
MACLIAATFDAFTGGVFVALLPMLRNCVEVVPRFTLVLLAATVDGALSPDFATGVRAFPSPAGASGKELLELSIFTGITFLLVRLNLVSAA